MPYNPLASAGSNQGPLNPALTGAVKERIAALRDADAANTPIQGLYAVGNDMASIMGGHYPGGGITLGPAMTFGYLAALDLAGRSGVERDAQPLMERIER